MTMPRLEYVADGTHQGIRWHMQRCDGSMLVTLSGQVGSAPLFLQVEDPGLSALSVPGLVEAEIAAVRKRNATQTQTQAVF